MPALRCSSLVKRYGAITAVDGLSLEVRRGECFGLLGPNGAGKTTTIEILEGLIVPDSGEVEVLGLRWAHDERRLRERLGISLQDTQLNDKLTVAETVSLFRALYRDGPPAEATIERLELQSRRDSRVGHLSGGQKQRLALACALVGHPDLLFLDEPTTGLDPQSRRQLWGLLGEFRRHGGTILLTTHYMDEAEALCDRVAIIDRGRAIALDTPAALIASLGAEHIIEFSVAAGPVPDPARLASLPGVRDARHANGSTTVVATRLHLAMPALLAEVQAGGSRLVHLTTHSATLEDVFVSLTGRHLRDV